MDRPNCKIGRQIEMNIKIFDGDRVSLRVRLRSAVHRLRNSPLSRFPMRSYDVDGILGLGLRMGQEELMQRFAFRPPR